MDYPYPFFMRWRFASWPGPDPRHCVEFTGRLDAHPQRLLDPRWRWKWPRRALRTRHGDAPYHVYFKAGSICMQTMWPILTPAFTVRIGPGDVTFAALTTDGQPVPLEHMGKEYITPI